MSRSQIANFEANRSATANLPVRPLAPLAYALIKEAEGWIPSAYNDTLGFCTIGYGHLIAKATCSSVDLPVAGRSMAPPMDFSTALSISQGQLLLHHDTVLPRATISSVVKVTLSDEQFGALTAFVFNVGEENFRKSTLLKLLNEGRYDLAAHQFSRWIIGDGKQLPGLVQRRACEAALFRGTLETEASGAIKLSSCKPPAAPPSLGPPVDLFDGEAL